MQAHRSSPLLVSRVQSPSGSLLCESRPEREKETRRSLKRPHPDAINKTADWKFQQNRRKLQANQPDKLRSQASKQQLTEEKTVTQCSTAAERVRAAANA